MLCFEIASFYHVLEPRWVINEMANNQIVIGFTVNYILFSCSMNLE
jgi:hypothetical protein